MHLFSSVTSPQAHCRLCSSKPQAGVGRVQTMGKWGLASSTTFQRSKEEERSSCQRQWQGLEKRRDAEGLSLLSKFRGNAAIYTQEEISTHKAALPRMHTHIMPESRSCVVSSGNHQLLHRNSYIPGSLLGKNTLPFKAILSCYCWRFGLACQQSINNPGKIPMVTSPKVSRSPRDTCSGKCYHTSCVQVAKLFTKRSDPSGSFIIEKFLDGALLGVFVFLGNSLTIPALPLIATTTEPTVVFWTISLLHKHSFGELFKA